MRRFAGWAVVAVVVFFPIACLLVESFLVEGRVSLGNYRGVASARVLLLFLKSAAISTGAALISVLLGGTAALLIETRRYPLRPALRLAALAPLLVPPYLQVAAWKPFLPGTFSREEMEWARILAVTALLGAAYAPLVFFFASQGIRGISGEVRDAARLAAGERIAAFRIVLPLAAPAIAAGAALVLALSFLEQEVPLLLLVPAYSTHLFLQVSRGPGAAFAAALPAMLFLLPLVWASDAWARRRGFAVTSGEDPGARAAERRTGPWGLLAVAVLGSLLVVVPLARLLFMAGSASRFREAWLLYGDAVLEGIPVSLGAAAAASGLAALVMVRSGSPSRVAALLAWAPLAVPGAALGTALIETYNRPGLGAVYGSAWILVIAGAVRFFPVAYHALAAHLRTVPRELWEAAALERPAPFSRAILVDLPLAAPGLALAATAVLVLQSGELAASNLLAPPGHRPLPVVISAELHYNVDLEVPAALSVLQVASVLSMAAAIALGARCARRLGFPR
jgi:iron(III) transport system permease protein